MGDVLQFPQLNKQENENTVKNDNRADATVVDVTQKILEQQSEDRRKVQRVVLNEFISAHVHVPGRGLLRVILKDIHEGGLAFDLGEREGAFNRGETLEMRFYMNHETYFKFTTKVAHFTHNTEDGVYRHGCQFVGEGINDVALQHFISFLQNIAASLKTDRGDRTISQIYS